MYFNSDLFVGFFVIYTLFYHGNIKGATQPRQNPVIFLQLFNINYTSIDIRWNKLNGSLTSVPFHHISYYQGNRSEIGNTKMIDADWTQATVTVNNLLPGTQYCFYVGDVGALTNISEINCNPTLGYGSDNPCPCDLEFADALNPCDVLTGACNCQNKLRTGKCDVCISGYFIHEHVDCLRCSCSQNKSDGTCGPDSRGIPQCKCIEHFEGPSCDSCADGFYLVDDHCEACNCNDNEAKEVPICDIQGICLSCDFGTSGDHCELCLNEFVGNALARNCTPLVTTSAPLSQGNVAIISGVCAAIVLPCVLSVLFIFIYRWHRNRRLRFSHMWSMWLSNEPTAAVNFSELVDRRRSTDSEQTMNGFSFGRLPFESRERAKMTEVEEGVGDDDNSPMRMIVT